MNKISFIFLVILISCKSVDKTTNNEVRHGVPGPHAIVYKTVGNYNDLVPVILSDDKSRIISYPDPRDVKIGDHFQTPTELNNNYLLDNRGINSNVAFLKYTYEEYYELKAIDNAALLYDNIIHKNPLVEMYDCGLKSQFSDIETQLNKVIDQGGLAIKFKKIL